MPDGRAAVPESFTWLRGKARYDDGWIILEQPEEYPYIQEGKGAVFALAGVHEPADAVAFASTYGLLRHGPGAAELREPFASWDEAAGNLSVWLRTYRELRRAVDGDRDAVQALWELWEPRVRPGFVDAATTDHELLCQVSAVLGDAIAAGLKGVETSFTSSVFFEGGSPGEFWFAPRLPNLLAGAYYELAMIVSSRQPLRSCEHCGRMFPGTDPRRRFCGESCANRVRYRRWAEKHRLNAAS